MHWNSLMLAQMRVVVAEDTSVGPSRRGAKDGHHFYSTLTCALWNRHDFPRPARYTLLQGVRTDTRHDRAGDSAVAGPRSPAPRLLRTCPHPTNVPNISTLWQPLASRRPRWHARCARTKSDGRQPCVGGRGTSRPCKTLSPSRMPCNPRVIAS